jgi:hypothetical protein
MGHSPLGRRVGNSRKHRDTCDAAPFSSTLVNTTHFFLPAAGQDRRAFQSIRRRLRIGRPSRKLILFGQKDRHDPSCHSRVCWIGRMEPEIVIVIVDFEEDLPAGDLDETKIVLAKRVIVLIKIIVSRNRDENGLV